MCASRSRTPSILNDDDNPAFVVRRAPDSQSTLMSPPSYPHTCYQSQYDGYHDKVEYSSSKLSWPSQVYQTAQAHSTTYRNPTPGTLNSPPNYALYASDNPAQGLPCGELVSPTSEASAVTFYGSSTKNPRLTEKNVYPCPYAVLYSCAATFTTSGHASRHGKTHTGEKGALCPVCNRPFTRKDNMKQHLRTYRSHLDDRASPSDIDQKWSTNSAHNRYSSGQLESQREYFNTLGAIRSSGLWMIAMN
jgi:hypothetical protein